MSYRTGSFARANSPSSLPGSHHSIYPTAVILPPSGHKYLKPEQNVNKHSRAGGRGKSAEKSCDLSVAFIFFPHLFLHE